MSKFTDWFPPEVKPVHVGWYQCQYCMTHFWWNGKKRQYGAKFFGKTVKKGWRGLKEKAE